MQHGEDNTPKARIYIFEIVAILYENVISVEFPRTAILFPDEK